MGKYRLIIFLVFFSFFSCEEGLIETTNQMRNNQQNTSDTNLNANLQLSTVTVSSPFNYCNSYSTIGGGNGYAHIISTGNKLIVPRLNGSPKSASQLGIELSQVIAAANAGDVIFIDPACVIDVPSTIQINNALTIASNRGLDGSQGAIIRSNLGELFQVNSSGVRISGVRIQGFGSSTIERIGIIMTDHGNINTFEVDNCEIFSFTTSVLLKTPNHHFYRPAIQYDYRIHNNFIHDNVPYISGSGGYGVSVLNLFAKIYANIFGENRHDIAGDGSDNSSYEAFCNTILERNSNVSNFDMHSGYVGESNNSTTIAGNFISIHHNDFQDINPQANIFPCGRPRNLCLISNNKFKTGNIYGASNNDTGNFAIQQEPVGSVANSSSVYGNIVAVNNIYNDNYLGWYVREAWDKTRTDNFIRIPSTNDLLSSNFNATLSNSPISGWINIQTQELDYQFGDFNGDGITDIFKTDGQDWYYLPINTGYTDNWNYIGSSGYPLGTTSLVYGNDLYKIEPRLIFSNFDSDNFTDVLVTTGSTWDVSHGSNPGWVTWAGSTTTVNELLFGRFYYPGYQRYITDVFLLHEIWSISFDGSNWRDVNTNTTITNIPYLNLKVGDFNADGYSDIFYSNGIRWYYSDKGTSNWVGMAYSTLVPDKLVIGDFNCDGKSDVIGLDNGIWKVSLGGVNSFHALNTSNFSLDTFNYGSLK